MHIWPQGRISDLRDADLAAGALVWQQGHWSGSRDANLASWLQIWPQMGFSVVELASGLQIHFHDAISVSQRPNVRE